VLHSLPRAVCDARLLRGLSLYTFEHLVGENIHRYRMSLTSLERQVSDLVNSDTCPRPTTGRDEPAAARPAAVHPGALDRPWPHLPHRRHCPGPSEAVERP
jgi:hypothetical protein